MVVTVTAASSAMIMQPQSSSSALRPISSKRYGMRITLPHSNTRVRKNEIVAEIRPLLSAVKNDEPKILIPDSIKEIE